MFGLGCNYTHRKLFRLAKGFAFSGLFSDFFLDYFRAGVVTAPPN